jgi:hypothetical protein
MANGYFPDLPQSCFPGFPAVFPLVCSRVLCWFFPNTKAGLQFSRKFYYSTYTIHAVCLPKLKERNKILEGGRGRIAGFFLNQNFSTSLKP